MCWDVLGVDSVIVVAIIVAFNHAIGNMPAPQAAACGLAHVQPYFPTQRAMDFPPQVEIRRDTSRADQIDKAGTIVRC